ncbi:hypothetical protein [Brevundimonas sp. Root1279]|uniref:hypothetical protein n=1 Tax=Brevundimonas sp. Root1279 TaxID=1736443 RepID=UPI0006F89B70|nr:hypothetical protein [Brevundimonas sp. Root1279]KQW78449.1 hypothetical protein ASC65_16515 [Brevundimonas sp. Root1279]
MLLLGRLLLLLAAVGSLAVNWEFATTDKAWVLAGSPPETYPEFVYVLAGAPLAFAAFIGALSGLWTGRPGRGGSRKTLAILLISIGSLAVSVWLACLPYLADPAPPRDPAEPVSRLSQLISNALFMGSPLLMVVQILLIGWVIVESRRSRPPRALA